MLEPLKRNALDLETLQLFRRVLGADGDLNSPDVIDAFVEKLRTSLVGMRDRPTVVRGIRAQAAFAQLVVALDGCQMMLTVDAGDIYADGHLSSGDFLLVLRNGRRLLIEVKSVGVQTGSDGKVKLDKSQWKALRGKDVAGLCRTASLLNAEPFYAAHFELLNIWTLVGAAELTPRGTNHFRLTLTDDLLRNQLNLLGDRSVGVVAPIEVVFHPAPGEEPKQQAGSADIIAPFKPGQREIRVGGVVVSDQDDFEFAMFLAIYGGWRQEFRQTVRDGRIVDFRVVASPEEPAPGQPFQILGALSHMYSRYFFAEVEDGSGAASVLDIAPTPGLIARYMKRPPEDREFSTWVFDLSPRPAD